MAWRHKSKSEKNLIRTIGFLVFALLCFIIAVIAMNFAFKARIQELEDEINDLKAAESESTTDVTDDFQSSTTTLPTVTTTDSETTTLTSSSSSTTTDGSTSSSSDTTATESTMAKTDGLLYETLRSLLTDFSGLSSSSKSIEKTVQKGSIISKSHGRFIIMADINNELSNIGVTSSPGSGQQPVTTQRSELDTLYDDTEDDFETTTDSYDEVAALFSREGSGHGKT